MDDVMTDLLADGILQRRLAAYAEARLTPDLATSSRLRARVLAVAHRQSALALADPGLALVADPDRLRLDMSTPREAGRPDRPARARTREVVAPPARHDLGHDVRLNRRSRFARENEERVARVNHRPANRVWIY